MALNFTDSQLRELTGRLINADEVIKAQEEQAAKAGKNKQDYKDLDDQEKVFFDNWMALINHFQEESKLLNGTQRSLYDEANIDPSARLSPGNAHFTGWAGYKPKLLTSNNGNPTSVYSGFYEIERINRLIEWIGYIINGFTGPAISGTGHGYASGSFQVDSPVALPAGSHILLYQANAAVWGICTGTSVIVNPTPPPANFTGVTLTVLDSYGTLSGNFTYTFSRSGFTDAVRLSTNNDGYLLMCKQILLNTSTDLLAVIDAELVHLNANDSSADSATVSAAKTATNSFRTTVQNWINLIGQTRYGDTNINPYNTALGSRKNTYIPNRITQISTSLGAVNQTPDGNFIGSGRYLDLFASITFRIHKITGFLRNYYHQDLAVGAAQEQSGVKTAELNRNKDIAVVKVLVDEPTNTTKIALKDMIKLNIGDAVKVMDNVRTNILDYTIVDIVEPNIVVLSDVIPSTYTVENQARLVKLL